MHQAGDVHFPVGGPETRRERKETTARFWDRAGALLHAHGVTVRRVWTDSRACYRSKFSRSPTRPALRIKRVRTGRNQPHSRRVQVNRGLGMGKRQVPQLRDCPSG